MGNLGSLSQKVTDNFSSNVDNQGRLDELEEDAAYLTIKRKKRRNGEAQKEKEQGWGGEAAGKWWAIFMRNLGSLP